MLEIGCCSDGTGVTHAQKYWVRVREGKIGVSEFEFKKMITCVEQQPCSDDRIINVSCWVWLISFLCSLSHFWIL